MTVADELGVETGRAPSCRRQWSARWRLGRRMRGTHDPSCFRGRGQRLGCNPQQQSGDPGGLRGQGQLAARDQIELLGLPPDFQHHRTQRIAGECVGRRAQRALDIDGAHRDETARVETELAQPMHRQAACFEIAKILPHPHQRPPCRDTAGKACDEAGRGRALTSFRKHFVDGGHGKSAAQKRIRFRMAERDAVRRAGVMTSTFGRLDPLDPPSQSRKRAHACAHHAPLPSIRWSHPSFLPVF
jgi:hypothetical protein